MSGCNECSDATEQRYRHLLLVERWGSFVLGALIGASLGGLVVSWVFVTYLK